MHEVRASSGTGQCGDDLLTNQPGFANARDDHTATAILNEPNSVTKTGIKRLRKPHERICFLPNDPPRFTQLLNIFKGDDRARCCGRWHTVVPDKFPETIRFPC
jgi:hypothetical protein